MQAVMTERMTALWIHLRPSPIQFGKKVRRLLACPDAQRSALLLHQWFLLLVI